MNPNAKKLLKSYLSFTSTERMGMFFLCSALLILIIIRTTMHLWVHPAVDIAKEQKLAAAWETFKRSQPRVKNDTADEQKNDFEDAFDENETPMPSIIDLNTADSATLVRLKGIGPATASKIIAWRRDNGPFTDVGQLMEIHHFPQAAMAVLKKHLVVDSANKKPRP